MESALKAKASTTGAKALDNGYTVDMALVLAEFEGDEDAQQELESVIRDEPDYFDHIAQKLRDDRASKAQLAALIEELVAQGKALVEEAGHYADDDTIYVSALNRADGEPATDEDANAYLINTDYRGQHSAKPVISDWKELGFAPKYERYGGGTEAQKGPMTEEQKAERKTLIANNKAMESATKVRREWSRTCWPAKPRPRAGSTSLPKIVDRRRALRPREDYLEPSSAENQELHDHFRKRKVELGSCGRAYGTPCIHEHACIRCPVLRPDPLQRPRLKELIEALMDRKIEAEERGWLGELEGIETSLNAARDKLAQMSAQVSHGLPAFPSP